MRRHILNTVLALAALTCGSVAHAAPGQTSGSGGISSSWGPKEGNSVASIDLTFNSQSSFSHNSTSGAVASAAWTAPNAKLFGAKVTFWNVSSSGAATRALAGGTATRTRADATIQFGGTTFYSCSLNQATTNTACTTSRSLNRNLIEGSMVFVVAEVIPVQVGGKINLNVGATVSGAGRLSSLTNTGTTSHDEGQASMSASGAVSGTAFVFAGIKGVFGAGGSATVTFLKVTASGPWALAQRNKCQLGGSCAASNRVTYRLDSRAGGVGFDALSGHVDVEGCIILNTLIPIPLCDDARVFSWTGWHLGDFVASPKTFSDRFQSTY